MNNEKVELQSELKQVRDAVKDKQNEFERIKTQRNINEKKLVQTQEEVTDLKKQLHEKQLEIE